METVLISIKNLDRLKELVKKSEKQSHELLQTIHEIEKIRELEIEIK